MKNGEHQFLIKRFGFPHSQNSWEPASNILKKSVIKQFYDQHPRATRYDDPDFQPRVTALLAEDTSSNSSVIAVLTYEDSSAKFAPSYRRFSIKNTLANAIALASILVSVKDLTSGADHRPWRDFVNVYTLCCLSCFS